MPANRIRAAVLTALLFASAGCGTFCERWCTPRHTAALPVQSAPVCCYPVCCQPCAPAAGQGISPAAGQWAQPVNRTASNCCP